MSVAESCSKMMIGYRVILSLRYHVNVVVQKRFPTTSSYMMLRTILVVVLGRTTWFERVQTSKEPYYEFIDALRYEACLVLRLLLIVCLLLRK